MLSLYIEIIVSVLRHIITLNKCGSNGHELTS